MGFLSVTDISKAYPNNGSVSEKIRVIGPLSFTLAEGEFVSVFGPNGCGKTTLLNMVAGLVHPDKGAITAGLAHKGKIKTSFVFQNAGETLMPWRTCIGNLAFPLESSGMSKSKAAQHAMDYLHKCGNLLRANQFPYQMSGGQKQLLAIYRSLISCPDLLLLDEPFNALDYDMRKVMEGRLLDLWEESKITTLFVSHEVDEAVYLSDRVLVLGQTPATVVADIKIDLPRPRRFDMVKTMAFSRLVEEVVQAFGRGR